MSVPVVYYVDCVCIVFKCQFDTETLLSSFISSHQFIGNTDYHCTQLKVTVFKFKVFYRYNNKINVYIVI